MKSNLETARCQLREQLDLSPSQQSLKRCLKALIRLKQEGHADVLGQTIDLLFEDPHAFRRVSLRFDKDGWMYADAKWHFYCPRSRMSSVAEVIEDVNGYLHAGFFHLDRAKRMFTYRLRHYYGDAAMTKEQLRRLMTDLLKETSQWGDHVAASILGDDPLDDDPFAFDDEDCEEEIHDAFDAEPDDAPEEDDLFTTPPPPFSRRPVPRSHRY